MADVHRTVDAVWKLESARIVAGLTRLVHDVGLAEELAQDALVAALEQWPESGVPANPGAWLMTTAKRRAIDHIRRAQRLDRKHEQLARELDTRQQDAPDQSAEPDAEQNDVLRLMFISCHPVLPTEARVALTLRLLGHSGRAFDEQTAEYVKRWLSDIGIGVEVQLVSDNQFNETSTAGNFDLQVSTWGSNPDPDYILSLHTCAQRPNPDGKGGTTDSFFCDAEYDALYAQQSAEFDRTKRAELVRKMQQRLYEQAPLVMLDYDNALEGYRKDRFDGFQKQPAQDGVIMAQSSYWGYYSATPVAATSAGAGSSTGLVIGVVVVVVVVLAGGGLLVARRRGSTADERE